MAGKKGKSNKTNSTSGDMTRIEDLSQLVHLDDPELEALFRKATSLPELPIADLPTSETDELVEIEETFFEENPNETLEFLPEETTEAAPEYIFEETADDTFEQGTEEPHAEEITNSIGDELQNQDSQNFDTEVLDSSYMFSQNDDFTNQDLAIDQVEDSNAEVFEEKISLQELKDENIEHINSTSYGYQTAEANPAFSLKIENLSPEASADIIDILSEYDLFKSNSEEDFKDSLRSGALLIPQQSEFFIIHLATRLKRFGGSMIMGPSDKIFSSKIVGTQSSRGKITKNFKDQSKKGVDIIDQGTSSPEGSFVFYMLGENYSFDIVQDFGPIYATEILDEEDLARSAYAQKSLGEIEKIQADELPLFHQYAEILDQKKIKLQSVLKNKARELSANTVINMQFHLHTQSVKRKTLLILTIEARAIKRAISPQEVTHEL